VHGVDLAPGPAFVWWKLAVGAAAAAIAAVAFAASRVRRFRAGRGVLAVRLLSLTLLIVGAATVVRSFRAA
jgi:hypothetical protein